ncbi:MAG: glutamate--tRNA ligase [Brevinematales bacterium]|nr:glutamate--tRNA ligase [Brevinematales bacterium]
MVKTRFAPSPTGKLHVGNVRTALFAYLYAKHTGGKFVLRIEDTDLDRSHSDYIDKLMEDMKWLSLEWDEGPLVGGPEKSYLQSERLDIYKEYAEKLIEDGRAYYCYCTPEEIEAGKKEMEAQGKGPIYNGKCRNLTSAQKRQYEAEGRKPVVRFIAYEEDFSFKDIVKGEVNFPSGMVGDFVILRANGMPVYNYSVVIDDALMGITHVIRADEHLSNTVRQLMIYKALKFKVPEFAHLALVLGPDRQKLSKRHGATSIDEFRKAGYLPEALINYLALLGWSSPDGRELLSKEELISLFDLDRISPSPAIFDIDKLNWVSKHYIINSDSERIYKLALPYIVETGLVATPIDEKKEKFLKAVVEIAKGYCSHLSEIKEHIDYFITDDFEITKEARDVLEKEESKIVLKHFKEALLKEERVVVDSVFTEIAKKIISETNIKGKNFFMPIRAAITGRIHGPEIYYILPVIGKEVAIRRIEKILNS